MPSRVQVSPEEYLATDYGKPDREYDRGEVVKRSMPDYWHGRIQGYLCARFLAAKLFPAVEVRLLLSNDVIRIPDVLVFAGGHPKERFPSSPPLLVAEVVSEDDRYGDLMEKLEQYRQWGVPHIWVIDPQTRRLTVFESSGLRYVPELALPEHGVAITAAELFDVS